MKASVVVRSRDEAPRLRLTLASLAAQSEPCEIVVVDDGSRDATPELLRAWGGRDDAVVVRNDRALGRSEAANVGARRASGDVLVFLDGDTLADSELVARHLAAHRAHRDAIVRGETMHLRATRPFLDPETGAPFPDQAEHVASMSPAEIARALIRERTIAENFAAVVARATPGIYPGAGPRRLFELEWEALCRTPACSANWAAASGANQSVARDAFLAVGGFDPDLTINEHRELALRLTDAGLRMVAAEGARSCHMTHRTGWRDPLEENDWEHRFYARHPIPEVALLAVFWGSLASGVVPERARIHSLPELAEAARRCDGVVGIDAVRARHFAERAATAAPARV